MSDVRLKAFISFAVVVALQLAGVALLPRTRGFTNVAATVAMLSIFSLSYWVLARMVHDGSNLGIIIPLMTTVIPLATIAIGVLLYGESVSAARLGLLVTACICVGIASRF